MYDHIAEAVMRPALIHLADRIHVARFETMKIYSAMAAVRQLLDEGTVSQGDVLIDSSSGVYAYALAMACHRYGMGCHIVASATVDRALMVQLEILGATVEQVAGADPRFDQRLRVERIRDILRSRRDYHWMRQYHDRIHYLGYSEIARQIAADIDPGNLTIVGGVGSGASTGGLTSHLREIDPHVRLCGVQPFGSVTFGSQHLADTEKSVAIIAGIGSSIPFGNVNYELYDRMHWISFDYAVSGAIELLRRHAVFAGLSAGASFLAAHWEARLAPDRDVLLIAPDTGHRYVDTVFAEHDKAAPFDRLEPARVESLDRLAFAWSVMDWDRRSFTVDAGEPIA